MNKVRVAIVGLGGISQLIHLPIISKLKDVEIVAVSEKIKNRLDAVADKFNIKQRFQNYSKMFEQVDFDALLITTPTNTHREIACEAVKKCSNIFVEKPISRSYDEAKEINRVAGEYNANIMVGMNHRFRPDSLLLKSLITTGEIGDLFFVKSSWIKKQSTREKWATKKNEAGGGVLMDLGVVLLDLTLWFLNYPKVTSVSTQHYSNTTKEVEDTSISLLRCDSGSSFSLEVSWSLKNDNAKINLTAFGKQGYASLAPLQAFKKVEDDYIDYSPLSYGSDINIIKKSYENEIKHFIGAVRGIHPLISTSHEAELRMKIIDAMYKSAAEKTEINL